MAFLADYRSKYPQYNDLSDEELARLLRERYGGERDDIQYREFMGLPRQAAPAEPTFGDRIDMALADRMRNDDPFSGEPRAEQQRDPDGFFIDTDRPAIINEETAEVSTERTIGVELDGRHYNIPSIVDGEELDWDNHAHRQEIVRDARKKISEGWVFPNYATREEADAAAPRRSNSIRKARMAAGTHVKPPSLFERRQKPDPTLEEFYADEDEWNAPTLTNDEYGFYSNAWRLQLQRDSELLGNLIGGWYKYMEPYAQQVAWERLNSGTLIRGDAVNSGEPEAGKYRVRYTNAQEQAASVERDEHFIYMTETLPDRLRSVDFGGVARATEDNIKEAWGRKDPIDTAYAVLLFAQEQGIKSLGDMVAAVYMMPLYILSRAEEMGNERARNDGRERGTLEDQLTAMPAAIVSALFERLGAEKIFGAGKTSANALTEQITNGLFKRGFEAAAKRVGAAAGKAAIWEGGTEFFQEGVLEYLGETAGTEKPLDFNEAMERGMFGFLGGAPFGGGLATPFAAGREVMHEQTAKMMDDIEDVTAETDNVEALPTEPAPEPAPEPTAAPVQPEPEAEPEEDLDPIESLNRDARMRRTFFREHLEGLAQELVVGGGGAGTLVTKPEYTGDPRPDVTGRLPSVNPPWYQAMNAEPLTKMNVERVRHAVTLALTGQKLGLRQARVVQVMLDEISGHRTSAAEMDYARAQLTKQREKFANTKRRRELADQYPDLGEMQEEGEYTDDMDAETRLVLDLARIVQGFGESQAERVAIIMETVTDLEGAASALEEMIHEHQTVKPDTAGPAAAPQPETSGDTDLLGDDTKTEQEIADEERRRDEARNTGQEEVETGDPGDLFSEARRQKDIDDIPDSDVSGLVRQALGPLSRLEAGRYSPEDIASVRDAFGRLRDLVDSMATVPAALNDLVLHLGLALRNAPQQVGARKTPKLTNIQEHALRQALALGGRFEFTELLALPTIPSGKAGTSGQVVGQETITVNTINQLLKKGVLRVVSGEGMDATLEVSPSIERRGDAARRAEVEAMSADEKVQAIYHDPLTGLLNERALQDELGDAAFVVSIDMDSLKWINDNLGKDMGDRMLQAVADMMVKLGIEGYRGGRASDEFYILGNDEADLLKQVTALKRELAGHVLENDVGSRTGIKFSYGLANSRAAADSLMHEQKSKRERQSGKAERGKGDDQSVLFSSTVAMTPGENYVPTIGMEGELPLNEDHEIVFGDGRVLHIREKPVSRRHIVAILRRAFGTRIFFARIKEGGVLGYFLPGIGAVRTKDHNDLEVLAHEIAHYFDNRHPWVRKLYMQYSEEMKGVSYDKTKVYEGYAEFMRLFMTQEAKAREIAPGFYDAWMGAMKSKEHKKFGSTVLQVQELMHSWYYQGARKRLYDKFGTHITISDRAREVTDKLRARFIQKVVDRLHAFKLAEKELRGKLLDANFSGYKTLRLAAGASAVMNAVIERGTLFIKENGDFAFNGKGLKAIFGQVSGRMQEFQAYMIARRAAELRNPKPGQKMREHMLRDDEIIAGLAHAKTNPDFPKIFKEWQDFTERMLNFYVQAGLLSEKQKIKMRELNANYVPFNRVMDFMTEGKSRTQGIGGAGPLMHLHGSTRQLQDVFESIVANNAHMIHAALVNMGKRNFYQMIDQAAGSMTATRGETLMAGTYATPISADDAPMKVPKDQVLTVVLRSMGRTMAQYRKAKEGMEISAEDKILVEMIDDMVEGMENIVTFWQSGVEPVGNIDFYMHNGKRRYYEIAPGNELLMEAIHHLGPRPYNLMVSILGGFSGLLRRGVVLTPTFQVKNFIRDTTNAFTLSKGGIIPAVGAMKALGERLWNNEHYWEYMLNGGGFASIAQAEGIDVNRVIDTPQKLFQKYDSLVSAAEYANRIAEFKALVKKGYSKREAALAGREISTDFAMRGSSEALRYFTTGIPFLNARMQGIYRIAREIGEKEGPGAKAEFLGQQTIAYASRSLLGITIPSLLLYGYNMDDPRYQEIPDWQRDLAWIIFYGPGEDDYFMLPKPFETGMIWGTVPERMFELMRTGDQKEFADSMWWMIRETFNMNPVFQIYEPLRQLQQNKDWKDAPIVPEYMKGFQAPEQYKNYTSDSMIALSRVLSDQAGVNVRPLAAEHLIKGYFGTLGAWALAMADEMVGDLSHGGERPTRTWKDNILMSPFFNSGPLKRTHSEEKFYDLLRQTRSFAETMNDLDLRNPARLQERYHTDPTAMAFMELNAELKVTAKELRDLSNDIEAIKGSERSGNEKRLAINELQRNKNAIARQAMEANSPETVAALIESIKLSLAPGQTGTGGR